VDRPLPTMRRGGMNGSGTRSGGRVRWDSVWSKSSTPHRFGVRANLTNLLLRPLHDCAPCHRRPSLTSLLRRLSGNCSGPSTPTNSLISCPVRPGRRLRRPSCFASSSTPVEVPPDQVHEKTAFSKKKN
jgi:hypothetical protein